MKICDLLTEASTIIKAYHGTGHKFDKFSTDFVNSGHGYDAYGAGIYFAERRETAEFYSDMLGKARDSRPHAAATLYEVSINTPRSTLLNWNEPWTKQGRKIQAAFPLIDPAVDPTHGRELLQTKSGQWSWLGREELQFYSKEAARMAWMPSTQMTGGQIYTRLAGQLGSKRAASSEMTRRGIPGLSYMDGDNSDGIAESRNYVMWDMSVIKIRQVIRKGDQS